jgi:ectoine hydroxylase
MSLDCKLSDSDRVLFDERGFVLHKSVFTDTDICVLRAAAEEELTADSPRCTTDPQTGLPYRAHGSHRHHDVFSRLVRDRRLLDVAQGMLDDEVYVHQFKINTKAPFTGEQWGWHQDFTFWHREDRMPESRALTAMIFLDDVTEFNGPLLVVPTAHRLGTLATPARSEGWSATATNDLKYNLADTAEFPALIAEHGITALKASAGAVAWFHCNMPHASGNNMSPNRRSVVLISYNAVGNALPVVSSRPEWLAGRDFRPLSAAANPL